MDKESCWVKQHWVDKQTRLWVKDQGFKV